MIDIILLKYKLGMHHIKILPFFEIKIKTHRNVRVIYDIPIPSTSRGHLGLSETLSESVRALYISARYIIHHLDISTRYSV